MIGFDTNIKRINELKSGVDVTNEISKDELSKAMGLELSAEAQAIDDADIFLITVPTPITEGKES